MLPLHVPDPAAPGAGAGLLQANEVFKLVLEVGETLAGRLLMFDAMSTEFSEVRIWRDPACPACGEGTIQ